MRNNQHPLYVAWKGMRVRCNNKYDASYKNYGGRGIKICKEWDDFWIFVRDMGPKPNKDYQLDRINNDLGYFKENCRWATRSQQVHNRRKYKNEKFITFDGHRKTPSDWAKFLGIINYNQFKARLTLLNWTFVEATTTPRNKRFILQTKKQKHERARYLRSNPNSK